MLADGTFKHFLAIPTLLPGGHPGVVGVPGGVMEGTEAPAVTLRHPRLPAAADTAKQRLCIFSGYAYVSSPSPLVAAGRRGCRSVTAGASVALHNTPGVPLPLQDVSPGSPEPPITRNRPEPFRIHHIYFFYGQVNYGQPDP